MEKKQNKLKIGAKIFHYFEARYYDSDVSIWLSVDPLASKYPSLSPYVYCANNPVMLVDPDGRSIDEWNVNISTGEKTWVSDKGGDETQHINLVTNGGTNIVSMSVDGNKEIVNNLSNSIEQSGGWSLVGGGSYVKVGLGFGPMLTRTNSNFSIFSESNIEFIAEEKGIVFGGGASAGIGMMSIFGPSNLTGEDLAGYSTMMSGGAFGEIEVQTSSTFSGKPTFDYLIINTGISLGTPSGSFGTVSTTIERRNRSSYKDPSYWSRPEAICFAEGTEIHTIDGFKEIQNISVGDSVYSYDLENNMVISSIVTKTYVSESDSIYKLKIGKEEILVTNEHPFYVGDKGWIKVKDLEIGDELLSADKERITLESKEIIIWKSKVYNFEVDGFHNYFITKNKVLVHNK
ncbi:hypothetical protein LJC11_05405 [Bacteroidales bacterium OttesenSCG-928-I21]|nr:hypothetical protein [Bacteroidales bacterium OttesenSCG-928-I21]